MKVKRGVHLSPLRRDFSELLFYIMHLYNITTTELADKCSLTSPTTISKWISQDKNSLPTKTNINNLRLALIDLCIEDRKKKIPLKKILTDMKLALSEPTFEMLNTQLRLNDAIDETLVGVLIEIWEKDYEKRSNIRINKRKKKMQKSQKTKTEVVVFDFDGTLTIKDLFIKTVWEEMWHTIGYEVTECRVLHDQFMRKEFSHQEWCNKTCAKFKQNSFSRNHLLKISKNILLMEGTKEVFSFLKEKNIKIFILSGSVKHIIEYTLGDLINLIDGISANEFEFDSCDLLKYIKGTSYDFSHKATFINELSTRLKIAPQHILFVGNSINDVEAYKSGCRTLCVNARQTDYSNKKRWNNFINDCNDLQKILDFV